MEINISIFLYLSIYASQEIYCKEFVNTNMKAGRSQCPQSASQRPRRASGVSSSPSPKNWEPGELMAQVSVWGQKETGVPSQARRSPLIFSLFGFFQSSTDWWGLLAFERTNVLLSLLFQMLISSGNSLADTARMAFHQIIWVPSGTVGVTHTMNYHTQ